MAKSKKKGKGPSNKKVLERELKKERDALIKMASAIAINPLYQIHCYSSLSPSSNTSVQSVSI